MNKPFVKEVDSKEMEEIPFISQVSIMLMIFGFAISRNGPFGSECLSINEMREFAEKFDKDKFLEKLDKMEKFDFLPEQMKNPVRPKPICFGKGLTEFTRNFN